MPYSLPSGILVYRFGERGSGFKTKTGKILDFYKIGKEESIIKSGLFEDPNFPTEDASIFFRFLLTNYLIIKLLNNINYLANLWISPWCGNDPEKLSQTPNSLSVERLDLMLNKVNLGKDKDN